MLRIFISNAVWKITIMYKYVSTKVSQYIPLKFIYFFDIDIKIGRKHTGH